MDELTEALDRYVRAMMDYDKNTLTEWGPGSALIEERDKATKEFEKTLDEYIDLKISKYLMDVLAGVEDKLVGIK